MNSRYIRTHRSQRRPRRHSKQLYGSFEDSGKYIECWNCGAILDTTRLSTGEGSGITVEDFQFEPDRYQDEPYWHNIECNGTQLNYIITIDTYNSAVTLLKTGPDGNAVTSHYTPRIAKATSGCWFCGTKNLP